MKLLRGWKWALLLAILTGMGVVGICAVQEMFSVFKFGGIDTETNPLFLRDDTTPDSQNVVTDTGPGVGPRAGFTSFSTTTASSQAWNFSPSNGTKYHIIREGGDLKATTGGGSYSVLVGTVSSSVNTAAAQLGDRFYFMNTTDGLKYWNMSTVTTASSTLQGSILVAYKGRLLASGLTAAPRTIYISKFADGATWTAASEAATEADSVQVGGGLDEKVNGIYSSFNGVAVWFRNSSFGSLDGSRRGGFSLRTFSDVVGSAYPETAVDCDGLLRFLGPRKAVYEWNGAVLKRISDHIRSLLGTMAQGDANTRSYLATLKADFDAGTNYQTSNALSSGDVSLSTWTATHTLNADFAAGTTSNTTVIGDRVYLSTNNTNVLNNSFESGSGTDPDNWTYWSGFTCGGTPCLTRAATGVTCSSLSPQSGSFLLLNQNTSGSVATFYVIDYNTGSTLTSQSFTLTTPSMTDCTWTQYSLDLSAYAGRWIYVRIERGGGSYQNSDPFLCSGSAMTFYAARKASGGGAYEMLWDLVEGGRSTIYSGTFTSAAFDTALTSAAWLASGANWTTNSHSITMQTQSSSDGVSWQSAVAWSTGSAPASDFRRYGRFVMTVSTGGTTNGTNLPYLDDATLAARANYGLWLSGAINLGNISAYGIFSANETLDSGTVSYAVYSDTDTNMSISNGVPLAGSYTSSAAVTSGNIPSLSTGAYARLASYSSITTATNEPLVHNLAIQWAEGSLLAVPAVWYNQRYCLPMNLNSTANNRVLVYDRNNEWQLYKGINAAWTTVYNGNLLFGNTSGIFVGDTGTTDNGTSIEAYYKTKDFPLNGVDKKFYFDSVINTAVEKPDTLGTEYFVNGRTAGTSLGNMDMDADSGFNVLRLNVPSDAATQLMRTVALKFSVTGTTAWKLLMSNFYFQREPVVE